MKQTENEICLLQKSRELRQLLGFLSRLRLLSGVTQTRRPPSAALRTSQSGVPSVFVQATTLSSLSSSTIHLSVLTATPHPTTTLLPLLIILPPTLALLFFFFCHFPSFDSPSFSCPDKKKAALAEVQFQDSAHIKAGLAAAEIQSEPLISGFQHGNRLVLPWTRCSYGFTEI